MGSDLPTAGIHKLMESTPTCQQRVLHASAHSPAAPGPQVRVSLTSAYSWGSTPTLDFRPQFDGLRMNPAEANIG